MGSETVEQAIRHEPTLLRRYSSRSLHHQARRFFERLVRRVYPQGLISPAAMETRHPDLTFQVNDAVVLLNVKVGTGLFPSDEYIALMDQAAGPRVYPQEAWLLVTTYTLTDPMIEHFEDEGIRAFRFTLGEQVAAVEQRFQEWMVELFGPAVN